MKLTHRFSRITSARHALQMFSSLAFFLIAGQSMAQSTWTGGTSTAWNEANNWLDTATLTTPGVPACSTTLTFGGATYGEPANLPTNSDIDPFTTGIINITNNGTVGQTAAFTLGTLGQSITLGGNINTTAIAAGGAAITDTIDLNLILNGNRTIGTNGAGTGTGSHNVIVNGVISETGTPRVLTKGGGFPSATLTLAGNNTYTGFTVIETGTVTVSKIADSGDSNLGYGTQITMSFGGTGATLNYNGSGSTTNRKVQLGSSTGGQLGGTAGGTITASGSNGGTGLVFTAPTFIQTVSSTAASRTLTLGGGNTDANQIQGAIVDVETEVLPGVTTATNITKANTGLWILAPSIPSTYTGSTTVLEGTLAGIGANAFGNTSIINLSFNGSGRGTLSLRGDASTSFVKTIDSSLYNLTTLESGTTINVNQATTAGTGAKTMSIGNLGSASTANAYQVNFTGANNTSLSLGAVTGAASTNTTTPGTVTMNNTIASPGTLTLASYTSANAGTSGGAGETVTFGGAGNTIVSGAITPSANPLSLTKSGSGTVRLDGSSAYTGLTNVTGGVLHLNNANALPATGALTLSGGVLGLGTGNFTRALGAGPGEVSIGASGGFAAYGADRNVNIGGAGAAVNWNGTAPSISGNTLVLGSSTATHTVTFLNPLNVSGGRFLQANDGGDPVDGIFAGDIIGTGFVSKTGAGTLQLNGTGNSWNGGMFIDSGTVRLGAAGVLPDSQGLTVKRAGAAGNTNGVLDLAGNSETIGALFLGSPSSEVNSFTSGQTPSVVNSGVSGTLTLGGNLTYNSGGPVFVNGQATISANLATGTAGNRIITVGDGSATEDLVISGAISGGGITKQGAGTLALSGSNAYTGDTVIQAGVLRLGFSGALPANSKVVLAGGILDLNGHNTSVASLAVTGTDVVIDFGTTAASNTLRFNAGATAGWTGNLRVLNYDPTTDHLFFGSSPAGINGNAQLVTFIDPVGLTPGEYNLKVGNDGSVLGTTFFASAPPFPDSTTPGKAYAYDSLSRLTKVTYPDGRYASYQYDAAGNLSSVLSVFAGPDTNGNQVPDSWEIGYFGAVAAAGSGPDSNQNGIPDLLEFALAADPARPRAENLPVTEIRSVDGHNYLHCTFRRNKQAAGLNYVPQVCSDLQTWQSGSNHFEQVGDVTDNHDGSETIMFRCKIDLATVDSLFIRLTVEAP